MEKLKRPHYSAFIAASLDGRIALSNKTKPDWTSPEDWKFFQESLAKMDAVVVGRNTYEAAIDHLKKRRTFVLTSRTKKLSHRGSVTFVNPKNISIESLLQEFKNIAIVGGNSVYQIMLDRGHLDELFLTIEPLIFGRGKEMFTGGTKNTRTRLVSVKRLNTKGTLLLHYEVVQQAKNHASQKAKKALRKATK